MLTSGLILHMLWEMHILKPYHKQDTGSDVVSGSCGVIDTNTYQKHQLSLSMTLLLLSSNLCFVHYLSFVIYSFFSASKTYSIPFLCISGWCCFVNRMHNPPGTNADNHCFLRIFGDCHINNLGPAFALHKNKIKSALRWYVIGVDTLKIHLAWINNGSKTYHMWMVEACFPNFS